MIIQKIRLRNFKCFEELDLDFGKLTILTGANSSGKSSVINSLFTTIQSENFPFEFSLNGEYVNMGNFEDMVYTHDKTRVVEIGFTIKDNELYTLDTTWVYDKVKKLPLFQKLEVVGEYYSLLISKEVDRRYLVSWKIDRHKFSANKKQFSDSYEFVTGILGLLSLQIPDSHKKGENSEVIRFQKSIEKDHKNIEFYIDDLANLESTIRKKGSAIMWTIFTRFNKAFVRYEEYVNYISSFRLNPQKFKFEVARSKFKVGKYGEKYEDQILDWEYRNSDKFKELISILKGLKLLDNIKIDRVVGGSYETKVKTHYQGVYAPLTDVGFGVNQFLPIIVADLQLSKGSTLFISQPEVHLHPSIQSDFGGYVANQVSKNQKRYVIETHSEYFLNKIRLLIVKGLLKTDDVKVYFFDKNKNKVTPHALDFLSNGVIANAPPDFFATYMTDVMDIALNA
ncbi:MAG: DUF3696 domain-containing protein [Flavipsychrobacter sp.]|nr:DUF3696 domain-containing protein [Flavipsychrobacter sp.]